MRRTRDRMRALRIARRRARKKRKATVRRKQFEARRNALLNRQGEKPFRRARNRPNRRAPVDILAPKVFSIRQNPEEMVVFVAELKRRFERHKPTRVVMDEIKQLDNDALAVLLSVLVRFKALRIRFSGTYPNDGAVREQLVRSDFFEHLHNTKYRDQASYDLQFGGAIHTRAKFRVDGPLVERVVHQASREVWGEVRDCHGVYRTLVELMQNTHNHAIPGRLGAKQWWLSVRTLRSRKAVAISFFDFGVGIFDSLSQATHPARNWLQSLLGDSRPDILRRIFNGELKKTSSGRYYRGKGLPGIYKSLTRGDFSRFYLISNNVLYDADGDRYRELSVSLPGTYVYFELDPQNRSVSHAA